jgi:predicted ATPase/class 3 adenylate cyclase
MIRRRKNAPLARNAAPVATHVKPEAPARPGGTVTFLFSDIEGSTVRWERDSAAMEAALARHDTIVRDALEAHGAYVFKTVGDAFCAAFETAPNAIAAALDAQRALATVDFSAVEGLRARMALHTGRSAERDGDYFGPTLNRVARLLAIGHGGQVLLSADCTELLQRELPADCSLRDLGVHRLKDLAQPERVYQLIAPDLVADFPALRSLYHLSNNLPSELTSFVGREAEIAGVTALVEQHRLVTLVGSGGVGKTRLSLHVAANRLDGSRDGVWLIELAPLSSGDYIHTTLAQALGLTLAPEGDPLENLAQALKAKDALLVFDNCEHLVEPAAQVISTILRSCPKIKILASSRQGLGVAGEATYHVPSLDLATGVALFVERAHAASSSFSLTGENTPVIAGICRRLDGIPFAIELAAARVKMLGLKQLRDRLDERFRVLTGGSRDRLPRQQTLRALIDWSYDLLDERERMLFRGLGIFVNGFALEGAVAVGSPEDAFDVLASLVDKSLVLAEPHGDAVRYRLLESTRAYALEKLDDAGERDSAGIGHLRFLHDHFSELWEELERTGREAAVRSAAQTELEDVRSALDFALVRSRTIDGGELLTDVSPTWPSMGLEAEGLARCEAFLAALPADRSGLRARLSARMVLLLMDSGRSVRAFELATKAVEQARASGDNSLIAAALGQYAHTATMLHRLDDAERALNEAEAIPGNSAQLRITLLGRRAVFSQCRGDLDTAARLWEQLRAENHALGNTGTEHLTAINLAECEHARGNTQRAIAIVREVFHEARSGDDEKLAANLLFNLAEYLAAVDDFPAAAVAAREAIEIYDASEPDHPYAAVAIELVALVAALLGNHARAAILEGYAAAAMQRHGCPRGFTETATYDRLIALLQETLAPDDLARLAAEGIALTPEAAIALALEEPESSVAEAMDRMEANDT